MNQFKGHVLDDNGIGVGGVVVTITGNNVPPNSSTTTDDNGNWLITLYNEVNSKDITILFSKPGFETRTITNPQQTAELSGYVDPDIGGTLDLAGLYDSGKWKISSLQQSTKDILDQEIKDIYEFTSNNPGNYILIVDSSESQVPNNDNEEGSNRNFKIPGSLAKARAESLKEYVDQELSKLHSQNNNPDPTPTVSLGVIDRVGDVEWDGVNSKDNKYTKDQYTRIKAQFINEPDIDITLNKYCYNEFKIQINYVGSEHTCNAAVFKVYVNDILLYRDNGREYASLNNNTNTSWLSSPKDSNQYKLANLDNAPGDKGGYRYNTFIINKELVKTLLEKNPNGYVISLMCYNPTNITDEDDASEGTNGYGGDCHKGVGEIKILTPNGDSFTLDVRTPGKRDQKTPIAVLDPCSLIFTLDDLDVQGEIKSQEKTYYNSINSAKFTSQSRYNSWFKAIEVARKQYFYLNSTNLTNYNSRINTITDDLRKLKKQKLITESEYNKLIDLTKGVGSYYNENTRTNLSL